LEPPYHKTAGWLPIIRESGQEFLRAKRLSSADKTAPVLRSKRHLLDTRIPASPTRMFRQFLIFSLALTASHLIQAQATPASTVVTKAKPVEAPEPRITFNFVHVDGPYIAMTFDDGPAATLTPKLLDLLAARQIKATFFVIGQNVAEYPEIVARAAREGHEIGNHSWSHPYFARLSDDAVRSQLKRTDEAIMNAAGIHPRLLRPPYGSITARQKRWIHDEFGYDIILWDVDPFDWKRPGPTVIANRILKNTRAGSIVLSHDIHPGTIEAMPATLAQLQDKGFRFVTVSELIAMATPPPPKISPTPAATPTGSTSPVPTTAPRD
jgi:peptidoglycan/xylan/chitin deacetylase (PgdA/CDA1 family)